MRMFIGVLHCGNCVTGRNVLSGLVAFIDRVKRIFGPSKGPSLLPYSHKLKVADLKPQKPYTLGCHTIRKV